MAVITLIPAASRGPGTVSFGPFTIPDGLSQFLLSLDITQHTNPDVTVTLTLETSVDGGANYLPHSSFTYVGQPIPMTRPPNSVQIPTCTLGNRLPTGTNRRGRGSHTVVGGTVTTSATIEVT